MCCWLGLFENSGEVRDDTSKPSKYIADVELRRTVVVSHEFCHFGPVHVNRIGTAKFSIHTYIHIYIQCILGTPNTPVYVHSVVFLGIDQLIRASISARTNSVPT